jgi:hypothetical protein
MLFALTAPSTLLVTFTRRSIVPFEITMLVAVPELRTSWQGGQNSRINRPRVRI